ncbi:MAG: cysteine methyltransferase [Rhizobiales bacterium 65-79]|jgi:methylated-DNA-[protein]-cysteine S-methyltransferase|nr:methylated-DNA--[protein]-cysteine S-methyltransferase [Hyphomicrobiales bacterium]OJU00142.1 MAG: cysteine methyltransferase [Rhizobiales bacterium 65-79]
MTATDSTFVPYALIETAIGWIGIAWSERGLTRLQLPARDREATGRRLLSTIQDRAVESAEMPAPVAAAVDLLRRYGEGEPVDFSGVPVDLDGVDGFRRAVYEAARRLGFGETTTYGGLAEEAGYSGRAQDTGKALGQNPVPIVVPCHRILAAGNRIGGFSAPGGAVAKERLLMMEGVRVGPPPPAQQSFAF